MEDRIDTPPRSEGSELIADALKSAFDDQFTALLGAPTTASPSVDADFGARRALDLVAIAREPRIAERLALLPDILFAAGRVAGLDGLAKATLYVDGLHRAAPSPEVDRQDKLSEPLLDEAEAVRATLHKLLDYHFGDDAGIAAELAEMRARRGAFRIAATLARLATLARERMDHLAKDTKYWRDDLLTDADRLASLIKEAVTALSERDALELKRRAYGLLELAFADVRHAVAFVMRQSPEVVDALPVMKKPAQRKPKTDAA
jgi:hypothetical protein